MKLDFPSFGGGATIPFPRRLVARRLRALQIEPLDHASRPIRFGLAALLLFVGVFTLFGLLAPISGAAIATATVTVTGDKLVIQPQTSGIVTKVLVREGQHVRAGQALVRLNGIRSGAQLRQVQSRRDALRALEARLIAERDSLDTLAFPADLEQRRGDPPAARAMAAQEAIFARHRAILAADRDTSDQQLAVADARAASSTKQLALLRDQLADYRKLYARGFARLTTIRSMEQSEAQLVADQLAGDAGAREAAIGAKRVRDTQAMEAAQQLGQVQEQLAQINPQLDVTRYVADQDVLRAPAAGRVSGVVPMGPGLVLSGGRQVMEVVPDGRPMIVEAQVKPQDIGGVHVGQLAVVHFSSLNPHGRSAFNGHVVTLSPAQIQANGGAYYQAQIALDDPDGARRNGLVLQPGVPASVNIKTKNRTLFDYLFSPLADAMSHAMREK